MKAERAAEAVARHIENLILEGALKPGEKLISERDIAEELGVSRPTVRDGLKILEVRGLLVAAEGRGVRVAELGVKVLSDPLFELMSQRAEISDDYLEFRDVVESAAAALAASRSNVIDRNRVSRCLAAIKAAHNSGDPKQEANADADLHLAIYEASHNLVMLQIMRSLSHNLRMDVVHNRDKLFAIPSIRELLLEQHLEIGEAILSGNAESARRATHDHLAFIRQASREVRDADLKLEQSLRRFGKGNLASL